MAGIQLSEEQASKVFEAVEVAKNTGKIKKGTNEVTKVLERGEAKLIVIAKDVSPPEIVMHLPLLAKEKGVLAVEVKSKEELGAAVGIDRATVAVAVVQEGESKKLIKELNEELSKSE